MNRIIAVALLISTLMSCGNNDSAKTEALSTDSAKQIEPPKIVIATGKVEPELGIVNFSAPVGGIVKNVLKKEGNDVLKNEVILQLVDDVEQNKISEIQAQIQTQRSQILVEETQISEAKINLANKTDLLNKAKRLVLSGAETQQTVDDINKEIDIYQVNIDRAKVKVGYEKNKLNELYVQLKTAETDAERKVFRAPFDGKILDIDLEKGEAVSQFTEYAEFAPSGNLIVTAQVDELYSSEIKAGQQVEVFYRGSDNVIATGEVLIVSPYLKKKSIFSEKTEDQEDRRVREIKVTMQHYAGLVINSKVDCKIKL